MSRPVCFRWMGLALIGFILLALLPAPAAAEAGPADAPPPAAYVSGEIVLAWRPDAPAARDLSALAQRLEPTAGRFAAERASAEWRALADALAALTGLEPRVVLPEQGVAALAVAAGRELAESERLARLPWVRYAEPNYIYRAADIDGEARYPTDPGFGLQWNMRRVAAPDAWALARGSSSQVVADADARIINLSLGGPYPSSPVADAVQYATTEKRALVVAAGGNCAQGGPACGYIVNGDFYPAAYDNVLAVAASDHFDNWARYSNHRPYIDLAAPGGVASDAVYSTQIGGYGYMSGTSMATPLVSAAAALVWSMLPAATADQVAAILRDTADKVGSDPDTGVPYAYSGGRNDYFGYGRLNVGRAIRWAQPPALAADAGVVRFALGGALSVADRRVGLRNPSDQVVVWQASVVQGQGWLSVQPTSNTARHGYPSVLTLRAGPGLPLSGVSYGLVRVQAIYPAGIPPVDIPVELVVQPFAPQAYLPYLTSQAAPWYDPARGGRLLALANNQALETPLPFPVMFFGAAHTRLWVSDNGLVYFGGEQPRGVLPPAACPPAAAQPNNALYVLALDWDPGLGGQVYVQQPDADTFVVTWDQVRRAGNPQPQSFQLVLRRAAAPLAHYRTVEALPPGYIAAENYDGAYAQQIFCAGAGRAPADGTVVTFDVRTPW
ncbi:MAG: Thermophilic serine proteinase precursor [Chloroflexi bacterium ADurb.Bin325]|nr:MAG: Thermophilic serine proteinase precursor [Chloroflexi bacterium ADurb.Bin325]